MTILIYAIVLLVHGLLNQFGIRLVALLNDVSVWWHILGVLIIVGVLIFVPSHHQSASFVFGHFVNDTGLAHRPDLHAADRPAAGPVHVHRLRRLRAHDRGDAQRRASGPRGIVMSILVSLFAGWVLLIGITFAIQHYAAERTSATGVPPAQIFIDAAGTAPGQVPAAGRRSAPNCSAACPRSPPTPG